MKITVEMSLQDFEEFCRFREGKNAADKRINEIVRKIYKLRDLLTHNIEDHEEKKQFVVTDYEKFQEAIELAYEF